MPNRTILYQQVYFCQAFLKKQFMLITRIIIVYFKKLYLHPPLVFLLQSFVSIIWTPEKFGNIQCGRRMERWWGKY